MAKPTLRDVFSAPPRNSYDRIVDRSSQFFSQYNNVKTVREEQFFFNREERGEKHIARCRVGDERNAATRDSNLHFSLERGPDGK